MAKKKTQKTHGWFFQKMKIARFWLRRSAVLLVSLIILAVFLFSIINPPTTITMLSERWRLGKIDHEWAPIDEIAPVMRRSAVAAEDANFCLHWGFDMSAIRAALNDGGARGASTISQQVVKNVYLWQGRSWARKSIEALLTPLLELVWSKKRVLEVYLNVAEFDEGVFGVKAAAQHYFGVQPNALSPMQAARLAAVLPNPKKRSASRPTAALQRRSVAIMDGAATIYEDPREKCFAD
ncbi:monofunctional biosynthetic peptidoglycan transglycosylase [Pseudopelagicola sp. nBUS_19]|uniref:monofunctional biosynthetic peptidoglycan transglycosylase n=1 Tax=unclassified Pseudopelagicola TaxID=2649563 RepID=UPI003EB99F5A